MCQGLTLSTSFGDALHIAFYSAFALVPDSGHVGEQDELLQDVALLLPLATARTFGRGVSSN